MINKALQAVSTEVFPHRALAMQKLWMRRHMAKPQEVGIWKMASAVTQMNNKLIRFAGATEDDLFSAARFWSGLSPSHGEPSLIPMAMFLQNIARLGSLPKESRSNAQRA